MEYRKGDWMSEKLLPCPFCGSANTMLVETPRPWWVTCNDCGADGPTGDDCIERWNTRPSPPPAAESGDEITPSCIECESFYECVQKPAKTDGCFSKAA